ncbi:MAG TPA: alpha-amylase family glycosyl hydrolase [Candidatus Sulfotelmatobacter sp.]|jgi:cyclomaltodextrinase|nr:alpha-amylase family glycosyl hydrolase [Candidatus Sulfotelmatobacter sp.]
MKTSIVSLFRAVVLVVCSCVLSLAALAQETTNSSVRQSPAWLHAGVMYEVFPRDFSAAGDLNGVIARLDDLKDLGVNILWLMPVQPLGDKMKKGSTGSPYCVRDFYAINPDYGTTNDFKQLVAAAHAHGMKVVLDVVTGHTSWDSVLMTEHPEFYAKDATGKMRSPYPEWSDVAELDYSNPDLRRYMIDMLTYWVREFDVDGFRCDTAYTVPTDFWEAARAELEKIKPDVVIITDAGAKPVLLSKAFDLDYGGNLYSTLNQVISGQQPASFVRDSWEHTQDQFPKDSLHLRFTDYHNVPRATVRFGLDGALAAQVLVLALDGVPLFYNGMEVGDATESCDPALFEKMPVFWNPAGRLPLRDIYRDLIKLRKTSPALIAGDMVWLDNSAPNEIISFERKDAKDEYLFLINLSSRPVNASVELPGAGDFAPVKVAGRAGPVDITLPDFHLGGYGWFIYHRSLGK